MFSISIIIPVYNVEQYVQRCLESVTMQDVAETDMECLIVDDCGDDHSIDIVKSVITVYRGPIRFRLLQHEKNCGLSAARNTGLMEASGDYIMFVDSDDYLTPGCIRYFIDNLRKYPETDMVMGNVKNMKNGSLLMPNLQEPCFMDDPNVFFCRMLRHQIYLYAWNKLIRRSVLTEHSVNFIDGILYEDQSWSYQLFSHLSSVLLLPQVTYIYEYNPTSIVNTSFSTSKADKVVWSYTVSTNYLLTNPPVPGCYKKNMTVDYLLFMANFLMNGVDVLSRYTVSPEVTRDFRNVRLRLMGRSLCNGRLLLSCFFLLLFSPFCHLQKVTFFRHHYFQIERGMSVFCHLFDFLHRR